MAAIAAMGLTTTMVTEAGNKWSESTVRRDWQLAPLGARKFPAAPSGLLFQTANSDLRSYPFDPGMQCNGFSRGEVRNALPDEPTSMRVEGGEQLIRRLRFDGRLMGSHGLEDRVGYELHPLIIGMT
jgi:hypothetical protein